jgi:hypothetical protein
LVIGISVGATLIFTRGDGGGRTTPSTSGAPSDIASANDTGPVSIITDEPTCQTWVGINNTMGDVQKGGWSDQRKTLGPAAEWTPDQRDEVMAVAAAMKSAADQAVAMAKRTPHRVIRELYEQFIAYSRAYASSLPNYKPADDGLASASVNASSALIGICNTITLGSSSRSQAAEPAAPPTETVKPDDPADPQRFVTTSDATCDAWISRLDKFNGDTSAWGALDPAVPASQWSPERRAIEQSVQPLLTAYAADVDGAGRKSGNPIFEDFASSAALYIRTYVTVGESYTSADSWLSYVGFRFANVVSGACLAAAG